MPWTRDRSAPGRPGGDPFAALMQEIASKRAANGWTDEPMPEPAPPACPVCADFGYVTHDVPVGHPDFGQAFPCSCRAATLNARRIDNVLRDAHVLDRYRDLSFDTFVARANGDLASKQAALDRSCRFADGDPALPGLVLWGEYGAGKTGLAACALLERARHGESVRCIDWRNWIGQVQESYGSKAEPSTATIISAAANAGVLMIDELGSLNVRGEETTDKRRITDELIRTRHARLLPTIITTNLNPSALVAQFGRYAGERLGELCEFVEVAGQSLRFQE